MVRATLKVYVHIIAVESVMLYVKVTAARANKVKSKVPCTNMAGSIICDM